MRKIHIPGVRSEQPSTRPPLKGQIFVDLVARDGDNNRLVKAKGKSPEDTVRILNSLIRKIESQRNRELRVDQPTREDEKSDVPVVTTS